MLLHRIQEAEVLLLQFALPSIVQLWQQREVSLRKTEISLRQVGIRAKDLSEQLSCCAAIKARADLFCCSGLGQTSDYKGGTSQHSWEQHASLPNFSLPSGYVGSKLVSKFFPSDGVCVQPSR